MNKLCKIARGLDVFFKIAYWICLILAVVFVVFGIVLPFINESTILDTFSYNGIQFHFSYNDANATSLINGGRFTYCIGLAMSAVGFVLALPAIHIIRKILKPMKEGLPFEEGISVKFRTFGIFAIIYGVISNIASFIAQQILVNALQNVDGQGLMLSINRSFDLTFIIFAIILFLCSYVFRYGEELQKQADETL